jgi:hypothetical protein
MSNERLGPVQAGDDWDQAVRFVLRLARARRAMLHDLKVAKIAPEDDLVAQGARDIDRASAALRNMQPDLEIRRDGAVVPQRGGPSPAWLAIGGVWVSTLLLIAFAIAALAILVP